MPRASILSATLPVALPLVLAGSALIGLFAPAWAQSGSVEAPAPIEREASAAPREVAVFAGGCFWGVQAVFAHVRGVEQTSAGYTGGNAATADYDAVSTGTTGHAESVRVVFDPRQVDYADLLRIYFSVVADPTELDRQGPDDGPQYRSALFALSDSQARIARAYITQLSAAHVYPGRIVTRIEMHKSFYPAEARHQDFYARHPDFPYILINDRPKVEALQRLFPRRWKA